MPQAIEGSKISGGQHQQHAATAEEDALTVADGVLKNIVLREWLDKLANQYAICADAEVKELSGLHYTFEYIKFFFLFKGLLYCFSLVL